MRGLILSKSQWGVALAAGSMFVLAACMTVSGKQNIVPATGAAVQLGRTKIAILPVKAQASLAPDSVAPIRAELNKRLGGALRAKFSAATIADVPEVADHLNQKNALPALEQLFSTYDSTGVIDKRTTATLGNALSTPHLLLARLKAEKLDVGFISKATGGSLELMLVAAQTGNVLWSGTGEWKKGGIFGAGGATPEVVAEKLVELAFSTLPAEAGTAIATPAPAPAPSAPSPRVEAPAPQPAATAPASSPEPAPKSAAKTRSLTKPKTQTQNSQKTPQPSGTKETATKQPLDKDKGVAATGSEKKEAESKQTDRSQTKTDVKAKPAASKARSVTDL